MSAPGNRLSGETVFHGNGIVGHPEERCRNGLALVPEGRSMFRALTMQENRRRVGMIAENKAATACPLAIDQV